MKGSTEEGRAGIRVGALAGRSLGSAILFLALPVMIQQLLAAFVGMTDKMLSGHLVEGVRVAALDAIGIGSYVGWFIGICMSGLGLGGQAIIARSMGAADPPMARHALGQAMGVSLVWGLLVGAVLWSVAPFLGPWTRLTAEASGYLADYLRILAVAMPGAGVMMVGAMCLAGAGETRKPAAIAVAVNFVNVGFSWALSGADVDLGAMAAAAETAGTHGVLVNPFSFDLGVAGIAAGTAIGYGVGALLTWRVLIRGVQDLSLERAELRPRKAMLVRFLRVGVPNFMEGLAMWGVNIVVLFFIGGIAAKEGGLQGAHIIAIQWESFSFLPGFAIGGAAATLAGQHLGARDPDGAAKAILVCAGLSALLMGGLGVVFMTAGERLTRAISSEPLHLELVPQLLFICGTTQVFFAISMAIRQGLRGVGDTRWCLLITTFCSYGVRLPLTYYLGVVMGLGLPGIWYGLCGEFVIRAGLFGGRFLHGGWKRVEV